MAEKMIDSGSMNGISSGDNSTFLKRFYEAEEVDYDSPGRKLSLLFEKTGKNPKNAAGDRSGKTSGNAAGMMAGAESEDVFASDTLAWKDHEKKALAMRTKVSLFLLLVVIPATVIIGMYFFRNADYSLHQSLPQKLFGSRIYYFLSLLLMIYSLIPFFMVFEGRKPQARELVILATMIALNCAGRAAFFMVPDFKPIYAITIISGIAFGAESGFLVGSMSMLVSNFLFGQGPWTPWQMFAMGFIGFLSGILYRTGVLSTKKLPLSIYGFFMGFIVYGGIMNPAAMFMSVGEPSWQTLLAYYISGVPVDLIKGVSTFIFLWFGAKPMLEKLQRVKVKYGLID